IASPGVRDVKLAGGTGECRITITLEGATYDPDDSFADDEDETEIFRRPTASDVHSPLDQSNLDEARGRSRATKDPDHKATRARDAEPPPRDEGRASRATRGDDGSGVAKLLEEGKELVGAGDVQAAIDVLEKAVRLDKNHAEAVSTLGQTYARAGDWERARRAFKHLTTIRPDDADAHIYLAAAAMDCERLDDARDALASAVKLAPENARAYKYAAKLYERQGDSERAKKFRAKYEQLKGRWRRLPRARRARRRGGAQAPPPPRARDAGALRARVADPRAARRSRGLRARPRDGLVRGGAVHRLPVPSGRHAPRPAPRRAARGPGGGRARPRARRGDRARARARRRASRPEARERPLRRRRTSARRRPRAR